MSQLGNISSYMSFFNSLISNQISQNQFTNYLNQTSNQTSTQSPTNYEETLPPALSAALSSLASTLNAAKSTGYSLPINNASVAYTVNSLVNAGADAEKMADLIGRLAGNTGGNILFNHTGGSDHSINIQNRVQISGTYLQSFLNQANQLAMKGKDVNAYMDASAAVLAKADDDDFKRFVNVTNTVLARGEDLQKFYDFTVDIMNRRSYDMESNIFSVQNLMNYGISLDSSVTIMKNMVTTNLEGRNNLVDLSRVIVDARNKGAYMPYFLQQMANSGDTRGFLNAYMDANGLESKAPDFSKFARIERIDGEDMVIEEGESAAIFAQAISSQHGLLGENVLYWSSLQTGAMSNGSSYLDLSKLQAGTYDIYVKIGGYGGGTDTAKKRVIVKPKEANYLVDGDSTSDSNLNSTNSTLSSGISNTSTNSVQSTTFTPPPQEPSDVNKMWRLYEIFKDNVTANDIYDYLDSKIGSQKIIDFLNQNGQSELAAKYSSRSVGWTDMLTAIIKDPLFYQKSTAEFRSYVSKSEAASFMESKGLTDSEIVESLWLLGYRDAEEGLETDEEEVTESSGQQSSETQPVEVNNDGGIVTEVTTSSVSTPTPDGGTVTTTVTTTTVDSSSGVSTSSTSTVVADPGTTEPETTVTETPVEEPAPPPPPPPQPKLNPTPPANAYSLATMAVTKLNGFIDNVESGTPINSLSLNQTISMLLNKLFDVTDPVYNSMIQKLKATDTSASDTAYILRSFRDILAQVYGIATPVSAQKD